MANCIQYQSMTTREKVEFIGKLVHLVTNDETSFSRARGMILRGEVQGLLDDVVFNPPTYKENDQLTTID
jgi:hypothetical protein